MKCKMLPLVFAMATLCLPFTGCKKTPSPEAQAPAGAAETTQGETAPSAESGLAVAVAVLDQKEDLTAYIPADTPFAITASIQANRHPQIQTLLKAIINSSDAVNAFLTEEVDQLEEFTPENYGDIVAPDFDWSIVRRRAEYAKKLRDEAMPWVKDPVAKLKEVGVDLQDLNLALYSTKGHVVARLNVTDPTVLKSSLEKFINFVSAEPLIVNDFQDASVKDVQVGDETWMLLSLRHRDIYRHFFRDDYRPNKFNHFALHLSKDHLTIIFNADEKLEGYNDFLAKASTAVSHDVLPKLDQKTYLTGFVDSKNLQNAKKQFGYSEEAQCLAELSELFDFSSGLKVVAQYEGDNKLVQKLSLLFSNQEALKKLQAIHGSTLSLASDKASVLDVQINLDFTKTLDLLVEVATALSSHERFECNFLRLFGRDAKHFSKLMTEPNANVAMVRSLISGITGVSITFDSLNSETRKIDQMFTGAFALSGQAFDKKLAMIAPLVKDAIPELVTLTPNANDALYMNLQSIVGKMFVVGTYLTDTDFVLSTAGYDSKQLALGKHDVDKALVSYHVAFKPFLSKQESVNIDEVTPDYRLSFLFENIFVAFNKHFTESSFSQSIDTDGNGLVLTSTLSL